MDSSLFAHRGHALRTGRFSEPGRAYLLTAVTHERKPVFNDWQLARLLIAEMRHAHESKAIESLAWVLMPDHLHWLIELSDTPVQALMQRIKSRSAIAINKTSAVHNGKLWQRGFHDRALRREDDMQAIARYIVANPLRAGLVRRIGDYPLWDAIWL
jgi:REP element-mobilizing transposase RayT